MGLFGKRKTRATRRAEARAIKARAKLEAKLSAKNEVRRFKAAQRAESKALKGQLKAQRDSDHTALKVAEAELKAVREGKLLSPTRIRRILTVSRLLAPIVVPLAYRVAIAARGLIDQRRADQLGVPLAQIGQFQGRLENVPRIEQQLLSLTRDYDNIKKSYDSLLEKRINARLAENLEKSQQGEQFTILEKAIPPDVPSGPNKMLLLLAGLACGSVAGIALALLREQTDHTYADPESLQAAFPGVPLLAIIPMIAAGTPGNTRPFGLGKRS